MGDWKVKIKLFIPIVFIIILLTSTLTAAARPWFIPSQSRREEIRENVRAILFNVLSEMADRLYERTGHVPQWLDNALGALGR
jgi:hypothetical protein